MAAVFATGSAATLSVAKAILDGARILYLVRNENSSNLFGMGSLGTGFNPITGAMIIEVDETRAYEAKILLSRLDDSSEDSGWMDGSEDPF